MITNIQMVRMIVATRIFFLVNIDYVDEMIRNKDDVRFLLFTPFDFVDDCVIVVANCFLGVVVSF